MFSLRDEAAPDIRRARLPSEFRAPRRAAPGERVGEGVELLCRRAPRPKHLVEREQLVVIERYELGCPAQVAGELRVAAALGEAGLESQRLGGDRDVARTDAPGGDGVERDVRDRLSGGRADGGARGGSERIAQLGHAASSSTGSASCASSRSIATSRTTRAWYRGPSGSLDSGSSSGPGARPLA